MQPPEQRDEVEMLSLMLLIRRFEERASQQYQAQKIGGFCHLYIGQEAVVVGAVAAARPDDYLITAYRDHAHALARGTSADACMAELFGKATGCSRGLGGSMHYFDKEHHMYGGHAIVGGARSARGRDGFRVEVSRRRSRHALLFWRRRDQSGRVPRGAESGRRSTNCRSFSSARTTSSRWERAWSARLRSRKSSIARKVTIFPGR